MAQALSEQAQPKAKMLTQMVQTILGIAQPVKIILFGSWAKGTATPDSDYDLLIIDAKLFGKGRSRRRLIGKLGRALASFQVPSDILLYGVSEVEHWRQSPNHLISRALQDGKVLYERKRYRGAGKIGKGNEC
ncbi:MAG: nucleotidyltransferase domain-containing protein [Cyanobacteria bacterium J06554_6]